MRDNKTKVPCRIGRSEQPGAKSSISKIRARNHDGEHLPGAQDPAQPLSEKQRNYVNERVRNGHTPSASARIAGYKGSDVESWGLERNPKIIHALALEREKFAVASSVTKKRVVEGMLEAIEMAKVMADPMVMISGWREVGKLCGHYEAVTKKLEISVNGNVMMHKLQQMSDAELLESLGENTIEGDFEIVEDSDA